MNEQMIEHLIYRIGALEKQANNTESRLSKAEQQMEVLAKKHRYIASDVALLKLQHEQHGVTDDRSTA